MNSPTQGIAPAAQPTPESLGRELRRAVPDVRVLMCSLHAADGDVLWLSEGFLGPDEHCAVLAGCEQFVTPDAPAMLVEELDDGRCAVLLRVTTIARRFVGLVMYLVDGRSTTRASLLKQFDRPQVTDRLRELAWLQAPQTPAAIQTVPATSLDIGATAIGRVVALPVPAAQVAPEVDRLCAALRRTEISLYVQRLSPLSSREAMRRYEVLLRSGGDRRTAPTKMLSRANKAGLASMIDRRVFTGLIAWLIRHRDGLARHAAQFSINLSATALLDRHFVQFINSCVTKSGLPPATFSFEIDEGTCLAHPGAFLALARSLSTIGCTVAVDDFSVTRRSLALLNVAEVGVLKVAPQACAALLQNGAGHRRWQQLAAAADLRRKIIVAKHVNDAAAIDVLRRARIPYVQAHGTSAPCPLDTLLLPGA